MTADDDRSRALEQTLAAALAEPDDERRIELLWEAAQTGSAAVRQQVERLLTSADPAEQTLGADLAGRLPPGSEELAIAMRAIGERPPPPRPEFTAADLAAVGELLRTALATSDDGDVLQAAIVAAGHLDLHALAPEIVRHAAHDDEDVRAAIGSALMTLQHPDPGVQVATLVALAHDPVTGVRDWALGALVGGVGDEDGPVDTPDAVAAYRANVEDPDAGVRHEAERGLGLLGDIELLIGLLEYEGGDYDGVELAIRLGDPRLHPVLLELREELRGEGGLDSGYGQLVDAAVAACAPASD